jgi:beta-phosphoglucomutase
MPKSAGAAIWDVDGTLVDTARDHFAAWLQLAHEIDKPFTADDFRATFGRRNPEIIRAVFDPNASEAVIANLGGRKEAAYRCAVRRDGVALLPGASQLLAGFRELGWHQAIGSSAPRENLDLILDKTATRPMFDAIVSAEDTTRGKPDPQVFLVAADKLGISAKRCVVFEDAVAGVEAAKAAGMKCVAVRFSAGHHSAEALKHAGADLVVESLSEIRSTDVRDLVLGR